MYHFSYYEPMRVRLWSDKVIVSNFCNIPRLVWKSRTITCRNAEVCKNSSTVQWVANTKKVPCLVLKGNFSTYLMENFFKSKLSVSCHIINCFHKILCTTYLHSFHYNVCIMSFQWFILVLNTCYDFFSSPQNWEKKVLFCQSLFFLTKKKCVFSVLTLKNIK